MIIYFAVTKDMVDFVPLTSYSLNQNSIKYYIVAPTFEDTIKYLKLNKVDLNGLGICQAEIEDKHLVRCIGACLSGDSLKDLTVHIKEIIWLNRQ